MRVAIIADFKHDSLRNVQIIARKFQKGLIQIGHDTLPISYRNLMLEFSPVRSKTIARKFAKNKADLHCCTLLADYQPEIVVFFSFRNFDGHSLARFRQTLPHAKFVGWYEDSLDGFTDTAYQITRQLDWLLATGGGQHLRAIAEKCHVRAAFMPNPCDPDVEKNYPTAPDHATDILFTGKLSHKSRGTDNSRKELIELLQKNHQLTIFGSQDQPTVLGLEYFRRISAARIALSVNTSSDIRMYHSDRLINYLACGVFVLAKTVPDSHLLFEDGKHLRYFNTVQQCLELVDYYLSHPEERQKIAAAAMQHAHQNFNGAALAKDLIDVTQTGSYNRPWSEII